MHINHHSALPHYNYPLSRHDDKLRHGMHCVAPFEINIHHVIIIKKIINEQMSNTKLPSFILEPLSEHLKKASATDAPERAPVRTGTSRVSVLSSAASLSALQPALDDVAPTTPPSAIGETRFARSTTKDTGASKASVLIKHPSWANKSSTTDDDATTTRPLHAVIAQFQSQSRRTGTSAAQQSTATTETSVLCLSPDSRFVVVAAPGQLDVLDLKTGASCKTFAGLSGEVVHVAVSPSQQYVLAVCKRTKLKRQGTVGSGKGTLTLWSYDTGAQLHVWNIEILNGMAHVAFVGEHQVAVHSVRQSFRIFDLSTNKTVHKKDIAADFVLTALAGSQQLGRLASAECHAENERRGVLSIWHMTENRRVSVETSESTTVLALAFSPSAEHLIGLCSRNTLQEVAIWCADPLSSLAARIISRQATVSTFSLSVCANEQNALVHVNDVMYSVQLHTLAPVRQYYTLSGDDAKSACVTTNMNWLAFTDEKQVNIVPFLTDPPSQIVPFDTVHYDPSLSVSVCLREKQHAVTIVDTSVQEATSDGAVIFPSMVHFDDLASQLTFSPDGAKLAYITVSSKLRVVQLKPAIELALIDIKDASPLALCFLGDSTGIWVGYETAIQQLSLTGEMKLEIAGNFADLEKLLATDDGNYVIAHAGLTVTVLEKGEAGFEVYHELRDRSSVALSDDDSQLLLYTSGAGGLSVLNLESLSAGDALLFASKPETLWHIGKVGEIAFCCSSKGDDNYLHIWRGSSTLTPQGTDAAVVEERFILDEDVAQRLVTTNSRIPALLLDHTTLLDLSMFFYTDACPGWFMELLLTSDPALARQSLKHRPNSIHLPLAAGQEDRTYLSIACATDSSVSKAASAEMLRVILTLPLESFPVLRTRNSLLRVALFIEDIKLVDDVLQKYVLGRNESNLCAEDSRHIPSWRLFNVDIGQTEDLTYSLCELLHKFPDRGIKFLKAFGLLQFDNITEEDFHLHLRCPQNTMMVSGSQTLSSDDGLLKKLKVVEQERLHKKKAKSAKMSDDASEIDAATEETSAVTEDLEGDVSENVKLEEEPVPAVFESDDAIPIRLPQLEDRWQPVQAVNLHYVGFYKAGGMLSNGDSLLAALVRTNEFEAFDNAVAHSLVEHHWKAYAQRSFISKFGVHLLQLALLVAMSLLQSTQFSDRFGSGTGSDTKAAVVLTFLLIIAWSYSVYHEFTQATRDSALFMQRCLGRAVPSTLKLSADYFKDVWNVIDGVQIVLELAFIVTYLSGSRHYIWILSILVYVKWFFILYYLQAFTATATLVRIVIGVTFSVKWFIGILILSILATANAIYILVEPVNDPVNNVAFNDVGNAIFTTFTMLLLNNDYSIGTVVLGNYKTLLYFIFSLSAVFVLIILLNLLIGSSIAALFALKLMPSLQR